jgi:prevent-host-death family protein
MTTKTITISEGKKGFTSIVKESALKQEGIVITKRGHPVAALLSYKEYLDYKKLRTYLKMLELSATMKDAGIKAADVYAASKKELEARKP